MISNTDLDIYNILFQEKPLTEKYLGHVAFDWSYSEVYYKAECTVGYPFDLFDKTIVGILLLDEMLSIEEIGVILGMNVIDNPDEHQFKDMAEYDILRMAIDNLKSYQMVEIGDINYSACRLTTIGKEYAEKGRKFKIEADKPFKLFFDHTSNQHVDAKATFEKLKGKNSNLISDKFNFLDEELMRQIAVVQTPKIYNLENGNSFLNPHIIESRSKTYSLELKVGLVYNLISKTIYLVAYDPSTKSFNDTFSKWLNVNYKPELIQQFIDSKTLAKGTLDFPSEYTQTLHRQQKQLGKILEEKPEELISFVKETNSNSKTIDVEFLWNNLKNFITPKVKEAWFFLPEYNSKIIAKLSKLEKLEKPMFFIFQETDDEKLNQEILDFYKKSESLDNYFFVSTSEEISEFRIILRTKEAQEFIPVNYKLNYLEEKEIGFSLIQKQQLELSIEHLLDLKKATANNYLKTINESISEYKLPLKKITKDTVLNANYLDKKIQGLMELKSDENIIHEIQEIKKSKEEKVKTFKENHLSFLSKQLNKLKKNFKEGEIKELEKIENLKQELKKIQEDCLTEYSEIIKDCKIFKKELFAEEKRIKEEVLSKTFIIDTNIFIYAPDIISKIEERHQVVISHTVINELDGLKQNNQVKEKASLAIKLLNKNKRLRTAKSNVNILSQDYRQNTPDNRILSVAYSLIDNNPVILTEDNGLQLKAKSLEIPVLSLRDMGIKKPKPNPKRKKQTRRINYVSIFKKMRPTKYGNYPIGIFLSMVKKRNPNFNFKKLGFKNPVEFIESLGYFEVINHKFLKLKSK